MNNDTVLNIETSKGSSFEVSEEIEILKTKVKNRREHNFLPLQARQTFNTLPEKLQQEVSFAVEKFYGALWNYILRWDASLDGSGVFSWLSLRVNPSPETVQKSVEYINQRFPSLIDGKN